MLEALEDLHSIGYLHRDVKPDNYTIGRREKDDHKNIYLLDFGMARKFINAEVGSWRWLLSHLTWLRRFPFFRATFTDRESRLASEGLRATPRSTPTAMRTKAAEMTWRAGSTHSSRSPTECCPGATSPTPTSRR
jgi:serine/threonine protein kinase